MKDDVRSFDYQELMDLKPKERFERYGPGSLTDSELISVVLGGGSAETALGLSKKVLSMSPGGKRKLNVLHQLSLKELMEVDGVNKEKALKLKAVAELSRRMAIENVSPLVRYQRAQDFADYFMEKLRYEEKENVILVSLSSTCKLINETIVSVGTVNQALLSPREVFRQALKDGACAVVLIHNHPGGDPSPSSADLAITAKLEMAGKAIGIRLIDHIIIGDRSYTSLQEQGFIKKD